MMEGDRSRTLVLLITFTLIAIVLAGCLGNDAPAPDDDENGPDGDGGDDANGDGGDGNGDGNGDGDGDGDGDDGDDEPQSGEVQAAFVHEPEEPAPTQDIEFNASASETGGQEATYSWEFGDGNSTEGEFATHAYDEAGDYEVTLNLTTQDGDHDLATRIVTVAEPPGGINESYEGSFLLGFPVEASPWVADHDMNAEVPQTDVEIALEASGTLASYTLTLLDGDGNEVASETGMDARITQAELEAGSYTVRVHMSGGIQGEYTVTAVGTALPPEDQGDDDPGEPT